jgi:hypothetical protein
MKLTPRVGCEVMLIVAKEIVEKVSGVRVELGQDGSHGGPLCDGRRFAGEFAFQVRALWDHLSDCQGDD